MLYLFNPISEKKLYKNPVTNAAAIKFNEKQFELYNSFLEKMEVNDESA